MSVARAAAARWRGVLIGACSGAAAVGAHSFGGGGPPHSSSIVLLVLVRAAVGAVASSPLRRNHTLPVVAIYLCVGQLVGHCALVLASGHTHGDHWSPSMALAHLLAPPGAPR